MIKFNHLSTFYLKNDYLCSLKETNHNAAVRKPKRLAASADAKQSLQYGYTPIQE